MTRISISVLAAVFAMSTAATTWACDKENSGCTKSKEVTLAAAKATEVQAAPAEGGCCIDKGVARAMKMLPQMTYKVGDFTTGCRHTATAKSEEAGQPIVYVVNGEEFKCSKAAMDKLASALTESMPKLAEVVSMVGDEAVHCPMAAAKLASEQNTKITYQLAGVEFDCPKHANSVAAKVAAMIKEGGAGCAKGCSKDCSKDCAKDCAKGAAAKTASADAGCPHAHDAEAKTASADGGCPFAHKAEAKTASAEGGCAHAKSEAKTASAEGGCQHAKSAEAKTASAEGGCDHHKAEAKTASAEGGCQHAKGEAKTASAEGGCPFAHKADAKTASAEGGCHKGAKTAAADAKAVAEGQTDSDGTQDTEALARAKQMIRNIVRFVATERESSQS